MATSSAQRVGWTRYLSTVGLLGLVQTSLASFDLGYNDDSDLTSFVTRPEIKAPKFVVENYAPERITPGYWFVAPYAYIVQESQAKRYYQACQTGPTIYDGNGELVWSGACLNKNQNACDFRVFEANGTQFLSVINYSWRDLDPIGHGAILDQSLKVVKRVFSPRNLIPFNMHEFNVIDEGRSALHIVQRTELVDVEEMGHPTFKAGLAVNMGIREVDLTTGKTLFIWWADQYVPYSASYFNSAKLKGPYPDGWDWLHFNAIDKNNEGDYLATARYTDAIYKVDGKDGTLLWTLGGKYSTWKLDGFNFSRPHDARFISADDTSETISLLDNAGDEDFSISDHSSALILKLDYSASPPTATVLNRWTRPDGGRSEKRGNFQLLPNGNAFVGWSENAYISEHSPEGELLMEAQFMSDRFVTYRAYKFNWTSTPVEPPVVKAFAYGDPPGSAAGSLSLIYVSWNGATEVASWNFYNSAGAFIANKPRTGFETKLQTRTFSGGVYAEALDKDGTVLGKSAVATVEIPEEWSEVLAKAAAAAAEASAKDEL